MSFYFNTLWNQATASTMQARTSRRGYELATGLLNCCGKRTITGLLVGSGQQFVDWSAAYRLFSQQRLQPGKLFDAALQNLAQELPQDQPFSAHLDDTLLGKTGRHIPGAKWRRDPLGPPFHTNFIWGQRFVQVSLAYPQGQGPCQARGIPVDFTHAPSPDKPPKGATQGQWKTYRKLLASHRVSVVGSECVTRLRDKLDHYGHSNRSLVVSVDGGYTNREMFKNLPERTSLIGRIRKDAKLYQLPDHQPSTGRRCQYGRRLATPEQLRQNTNIAWQQFEGFAAGRLHRFDLKVIEPVKWRPAGAKQQLKLIVIRPLGYRLSKNSKTLYRRAAYLICNDMSLTVEQILQNYLWRWEIEVNFRDQKTVMGCGQAQVRNPHSASAVPAFITAAYSLLLTGTELALKQHQIKSLPRPKWYNKQIGNRWTTGDICNHFRAENYAKDTGRSFSSFVEQQHWIQKLKKQTNPALSAFFNMRC